MRKEKEVKVIKLGLFPYDKEKVLWKLKQKEYDDVFLRGRGRLDDFIGFLYQTKILNLFEQIKSPMQRRPEIPRKFLHYCLCLKPVVESASINQLPGRLLEDTDTLQELGFTIAEIEDGFSVKNKEGKNIPVNINAFYDELERLPESETKRLFEEGLLLLKSEKFLPRKKGVYALDAVKLLITGDKKYQNYGKITYRKDGKVIKKKGYKLVFIQRVDGEDYYVVAAIILPLNQHESTVGEFLVESTLKILGEGAIDILVFDRGFSSGPFFDFLKEKEIDFVCPTKEDEHLTRHMQGLHRAGEETIAKFSDGTILAGYDHLIKMETCQRKINGILILKQGWYLNRFPSQSWNGICSHIYLTLFMFNTVTAFKSTKGRSLTEKGIIVRSQVKVYHRQRAKVDHPPGCSSQGHATGSGKGATPRF